MYFGQLRDGLLAKSQKVIRKHWIEVRGRIRAKRHEQKETVKKALRKFTLMLYIKAKKNIEIIHHFRKYRRMPVVRSWSDRSLGKI